MNLEEKLISRVLHEGSAQRAVSYGVHEGWFQNPTLREIWVEIVRHGSRGATRNQTPSIGRIERIFTWTVPECPEEPLNEIIQDIADSECKRALRILCDNVEDALLSGGVDEAIEVANKGLRDLNSISKAHSHTSTDLVDAIPEYIDNYEKIREGGGLVGLPFAWDPLNEATGGILPGTLTIIYAAAKAGKTWTGLEIGAIHPFECANARVLVISCEMPVNLIYRRLLSRLCRLDYSLVTKGNLPLDARDDCFDHLSALQKEQIERVHQEISQKHRDIRVVYSGSSGGINFIRNEVEKFEPDIVLVDGLYLLANDRKNGKRENDHKALSDVTQDLKALALELNIPIIATTQANRSGKKRKYSNENREDWTDMGFGIGPVQDADLVIRLEKLAGVGDGCERLLVTLPAARETSTSNFVIKFAPVYDFSLDMIDVTEEDIANMMMDEDEPKGRSNGKIEREEIEFHFEGGKDPFAR